jgi:hypothetical protein
MCMAGLGNSTSLLLLVTGRWRSTSFMAHTVPILVDMFHPIRVGHNDFSQVDIQTLQLNCVCHENIVATDHTLV